MHANAYHLISIITLSVLWTTRGNDRCICTKPIFFISASPCVHIAIAGLVRQHRIAKQQRVKSPIPYFELANRTAVHLGALHWCTPLGAFSIEFKMHQVLSSWLQKHVCPRHEASGDALSASALSCVSLAAPLDALQCIPFGRYLLSARTLHMRSYPEYACSASCLTESRTNDRGSIQSIRVASFLPPTQLFQKTKLAVSNTM